MPRSAASWDIPSEAPVRITPSPASEGLSHRPATSLRRRLPEARATIRMVAVYQPEPTLMPGKANVETAPFRQRRPVGEVATHSVRFPPARTPKLMGDEVSSSAFGAGQGRARTANRQLAPGLAIAEVRCERPQRVFAHAAPWVLECRDVIVGQQRGQLVAPVERQDGVERVELFGAKMHRLALRIHHSMVIDHLVQLPVFLRKLRKIRIFRTKGVLI